MNDTLRTAAYYLSMAVHAATEGDDAEDYWVLYFGSLEECDDSDREILSQIEQSVLARDIAIREIKSKRHNPKIEFSVN